MMPNTLSATQAQRWLDTGRAWWQTPESLTTGGEQYVWDEPRQCFVRVGPAPTAVAQSRARLARLALVLWGAGAGLVLAGGMVARLALDALVQHQPWAFALTALVNVGHSPTHTWWTLLIELMPWWGWGGLWMLLGSTLLRVCTTPHGLVANWLWQDTAAQPPHVSRERNSDA